MSQTVVVIHNEEILAARGRSGLMPRIQEVYRTELKGFGENIDRWREGLVGLLPKIGKEPVRIVLPSSLCPEKHFLLPNGKDKEIALLAKQEMQSALERDIVDYGMISKDAETGVSIVGAGVDEAVIGQFLDLCAEIGLEVSGVTVPLEGVLRMLMELEKGKDETAIFLFFDEDGLLSVLLEKGRYKYSGRNRIFSEMGTLDFGTEIVRNISGILQFHTASNSQEAITQVYYAGCAPEDFVVSMDGINALHLTAEPLRDLNSVRMPAGESMSDWISCVGAMMHGIKGRHDLNLLSTYKKQNEEIKTEKGTWRYFLPPVCVLLVCLLIYAVILGRNAILSSKLNLTLDWIEATYVSDEYLDAVELEQKAEQAEEIIVEINNVTERLDTYPELDRAVISQIEGVGGTGMSLKIRGYESTTGELTYDAQSTKVIDIPSYIDELSQTGLFYSVSYTGYAYADGIYTLSLSCILNPGGEDADETDEADETDSSATAVTAAQSGTDAAATDMTAAQDETDSAATDVTAAQSGTDEAATDVTAAQDETDSAATAVQAGGVDA